MRYAIVPALLFLVSSAVAERPAEYCSLIVTVVGEEGLEREARVTVEEPGGRKVTKENELGGVKFCDLGILPVTVTVGHPACNQTIVKNVPLWWGKPTRLKVIYNRDPCLYDAPPPMHPGCEVLFRVTEGEDRWIGNAVLELREPWSRNLKGDRYGRLYLYPPYGSTVRGEIRATGYEPAEVDAECTRDRPAIQQYVKMKRKGGRGDTGPGGSQSSDSEKAAGRR